MNRSSDRHDYDFIVVGSGFGGSGLTITVQRTNGNGNGNFSLDPAWILLFALLRSSRAPRLTTPPRSGVVQRISNA
jgi:hypothetical protein